jgi:hypothetical protein
VTLKGRNEPSDGEQVIPVLRIRRQRRRRATQLARLLAALDAVSGERRFAAPRVPKRVTVTGR